jgi:3D (Asp-Asp-Asp) domain-containing protein
MSDVSRSAVRAVNLPSMTSLRTILLAALCAGFTACQSTTQVRPTKLAVVDTRGTLRNVRTTAYTHSESDHIVYGAKSAVGTDLKYGTVRSAAADWSVYPVGTLFKIEGEPYVYQVDDYGSALVGTKTIDLYRPSKTAMNDWGARNVNIHVLKWGSFDQSLAIMKPRLGAKPHIRQMVNAIEAKNGSES